MTGRPFAHIPVVRANDLPLAGRSDAPSGIWELDNLAGRLAELSEEGFSGAVTFVAGIIAEAQRRREPVAWIAASSSIFYPPDFARLRLDLAGIAVVRAGSLQAAEWLLRSGAFGLVIIDVGSSAQVPDSSLGRLLKLAERDRCAVIFLTRKRPDQPSLGSMISLRGSVTRSGGDPFASEIVVVKDKHRSPGSRQRSIYHGPPGMH